MWTLNIFAEKSRLEEALSLWFSKQKRDVWFTYKIPLWLWQNKKRKENLSHDTKFEFGIRFFFSFKITSKCRVKYNWSVYIVIIRKYTTLFPIKWKFGWRQGWAVCLAAEKQKTVNVMVWCSLWESDPLPQIWFTIKETQT